MTMTLAACGGSGGTSAPSLGSNIHGCTDPAAMNYNSSATINDGSCSYSDGVGGGTSGSMSYYGFTSAGGEIKNSLLEPSSIGHIIVTNEMFVEINDRTNRSLSAAVFAPNCPMNSALYYSAVLLTNTGAAQAITVYVNTYSNTMKIISHAFKQQSVPSIVVARYDADVGSDLTFTCGNGKITASDGTQIYANGKTLVMKKGSSLWLGFEQATLNISDVNNLWFNYESYGQIDANGYALGAMNSNGSTYGSGGGDQQLSSAGFYINRGSARTYLGDGYFKTYGNQMSSNSNHALVIADSYTGAVATALVANFNGTNIFLMATPASLTTMFFSGQPADYYVGTGALVLGIEQ